MSEYWKKFYRDYVDDAGDDPFCQVGRTLNKQPMSEKMFLKMAKGIIETLELKTDHLVLDFCCGNGLLSTQIAPHCRNVVGVDFSHKLIAELGSRAPQNVTGIVGDALEFNFKPESFDRIVCAAALQHFEKPRVIRLFEDLWRWLKPGGILLVTDVLDAACIWDYFDSKEREAIYFRNTMANTPTLGTWFDRVWLEKLGYHAGFSQAQALDQSDDYWYSHYRFDLFCRK